MWPWFHALKIMQKSFLFILWKNDSCKLLGAQGFIYLQFCDVGIHMRD
jgi:hypothetical protein